MTTRYPIFIPSRDRYQRERALTVRALRRDGVPFRLVVVPSQVEQYAALLGGGEAARAQLLVLPDDDHVLLHARNFIRDTAEAEGHDRHWQLDDNIKEFRRLYRGRRIPCHAGVALRVCEDFSDRFENVGVSGLNYQMFVTAETPVPYYLNVHVYSCTLVNHKMPYRWRLVLNDDTDLCLQALSGDWCTVLLNAFMADKQRTMRIAGGNTNQLYKDAGDDADPYDTHGRFEMAYALERAWPRIVKTRRRFGRYQHTVNWGAFRQPLRLRDDVDLSRFPAVDEYGLTLRPVKEVKAERLRELLSRYEEESVRWRLVSELRGELEKMS